ncbi:hypothetical protein [Methanosarcina siciliae]|uniref:hypothetical protein n=1 Tax=Methanosarcina siciliae TaxID=38027 RepID=UPI000B0C10F6|nr:hypothetical protein [Methanosarcina siciliae]
MHKFLEKARDFHSEVLAYPIQKHARNKLRNNEKISGNRYLRKLNLMEKICEVKS